MFISQIPGLDTAIKTASATSWEAVTIVIILGAVLIASAFIFKWFLSNLDGRLTEALKREERLSARVAQLEEFVHITLLKLTNECAAALAQNSRAVDNLTYALGKRVCLMEGDHQTKLTDTIADIVSDKVLVAINR